MLDLLFFVSFSSFFFNLPFIIFSFVYKYIYLLELQSMKGCKALRHRFPLCGIESFLNSLSLSLCVVAQSVVSFFLFLSFSFFFVAVRECFLQSPSGKREIEVTIIK